jgi:hypothetical protein
MRERGWIYVKLDNFFEGIHTTSEWILPHPYSNIASFAAFLFNFCKAMLLKINNNYKSQKCIRDTTT